MRLILPFQLKTPLKALLTLVIVVSSAQPGRAVAFFPSNLNYPSPPHVFPIVLPGDIQQFMPPKNAQHASVSKLCSDLKDTMKVFKWEESLYGCGQGIDWKTKFKSHNGQALIWTEFGTGPNTTLILGGVHPDEITPIPIAFRFAQFLAKNPNLVDSHTRVIVAPLVNPDGFIRKTASRTNYHGVDLNRNFFTRDWYKSAKHWWAEKRQKNDRHFPGHIPNSEIETLFQIWLIDNFQPDKIISIHAPLGFYDYDGPGERRTSGLTESESMAKKLVHSMSVSSKNYKIVDYSFYPGSLGNYAGNERGIPTITLELETTDPTKVDAYWRQFSPGLEQAVKYPFRNEARSNTPSDGSRFLGLYSLSP